MDFFPTDANSSTKFYFEKSATYFDGELVPKRVHALLPHAKIITILISPARRAYSWYQHTKAHGDVIANNYNFHQVFSLYLSDFKKNDTQLSDKCFSVRVLRVHSKITKQIWIFNISWFN